MCAKSVDIRHDNVGITVINRQFEWFIPTIYGDDCAWFIIVMPTTLIEKPKNTIENTGLLWVPRLFRQLDDLDVSTCVPIEPGTNVGNSPT